MGEPERMRWSIDHAPYIGGMFASAIGTFVLSGWVIGYDNWAVVIPGLPPMVPNTAIMGIASGIALTLLAPVSRPRARDMIGKLCAVVLMIIAGLTLFEYLSGTSLGIDRLFPVARHPVVFRAVGRPAPQTTIAYLCIASAFLLIDRRTRGGKRPSDLFAFLAGFIALCAVVGYFFGVTALYAPISMYPYVGMAFTTTTSLLFLAVGTMAARANAGIMGVLLADDRGGFAVRRLLGWLFVFVIVGFLLALGVRAGLYTPPTGSALVTLLQTVGGGALIFHLAVRLRRLDAEQRRYERELAESRERLDLALRGADLTAWDWNIKSGAVIFGPGWPEMRGYTPDEIAPRIESWTEALHPDDRPAVERTLNAYFNGLIPEYETEHRSRTRSGGWIWIRARGKVFQRSAAGQPIRMVGTEQNISEQKRLSEELRIAEARSSGILAISADAIISIDDHQRIISFNRGAQLTFGYTEQEMLGQPLEALIPERLRESNRRKVAEFAAGVEPSRRLTAREAEIVGRRKNGEEFPADASISKLVVDNTLILTVALHDITEQRRRESEKSMLADVGAIVATSLNYERTLNSIARLLVRDHSDLCIIDVANGDLCRVAVAARDRTHPWIADAFMRLRLDRRNPGPLERVLETKRPYLAGGVPCDALFPSADATLQRRLAEVIGRVAVTAVPLVSHGRTLGVMTLIRTAKFVAFSPADVELTVTIAERAAISIDNGMLYRAAQSAIRARDDVLGIVAHDLRNPLSTIQMYASTLGDERFTDDIGHEKAGEVIGRAAHRMNRLIQDLLDVTKMEAGRLTMEEARVDVRKLLTDLVDAETALATSEGLRLRVDVPPTLPDVTGDRDRLLQVFENLLGNAMKFTPANGTITLTARAADGDVLFSVGDTGRGVSREDLPHLFDRFWQARRTGREGAGLGLPIVKGIVEAHHGRIWVVSAPQKGTTFYFTIPIMAPAPEAEEAPVVHA